MLSFGELDTKTLADLRNIAREMNISGYSRLKKYDLILDLLAGQAQEQGYAFGVSCSLYFWRRNLFSDAGATSKYNFQC